MSATPSADVTNEMASQDAAADIKGNTALKQEPLFSLCPNIVLKDKSSIDAPSNMSALSTNVPLNNLAAINSSPHEAIKLKESVAVHQSKKKNDTIATPSKLNSIDRATLDAGDDLTFAPVVSPNRKDRDIRRSTGCSDQ